MKNFIGVLVFLLVMAGFAFADDLAYISLDYCDTEENVLSYQIDPAAETGICYTLANRSSNPVNIKVSFVDGTFTNDERQNKACLSDQDIENFGQYVTDYDEIVTLNPGEAVRKEATMMYPKGMDGMYYGCVVYSVIEEKDPNAPRGNFTILMRKAKFIDVIVGDPANAQERGIILEEFTDEDGVNFSHNPKIRIYKDESDGKYMMQIKIKNISMTQQDVMVNGKASNVIGMKTTFEEGRKILKGESLLITKKLDNMPIYNLRVKLELKNTPMIFGDIKPMIGLIKEKTCIIIRNTITYISLGGLLLIIFVVMLLIKDLKRRKKNVVVKIIHDKKPVTKKKVPAKKITKKKPVKKTLAKKPIAKKQTKKTQKKKK